MTELVLRNRQRTRHIHSPLLRRVTNFLVTDLLSLERCELAIHLVAAPEMARINQQFLDHAGSTDVITFDYSGEPVSSERLTTSAPKLPSSGVDRETATESSTADGSHRISPSPREARTGRGVSDLGQRPSSPRPSPPWVGGEGDVEPLGRLAATAGALKRGPTQPAEPLHGEIFICIDDVVKQARQFRTMWQSELVRYLIHGVLHLVGYDDLTSTSRRVMKREENWLLRRLARQFCLGRLAKSGSSQAGKSRGTDRKS
jgi:rRNA maturation RNase YbeY